MQKVRLNILGLSVSQTQSGAYALVLAEEHGDRRIPIIIGPVEAQSIAIQLEGLKPPRPLTHDLFKNMSDAFDIAVTEVIIYKLAEGIFFSELVCLHGGREVRIDSRTSDAVALSLRFKCPIFTTEEILSKAGIVLDTGGPEHVGAGESKQYDDPRADNEYESYSVSELTDMMNDAIKNENYERASRIRDEIKRRQK